MTDSPAEALALTPECRPGRCIYQDASVSVWAQDATAFLFFTETRSAGAIGRVQGESLCRALEALGQLPIDEPLRQLQLHVNSAGAHFQEPLEGLFYLNHLLEMLWQMRSQGVTIRVVCTGWLYGGMAMMFASVAHAVVLSASASMGLLGKRVLGNTTELILPASGFQPAYLALVRVP